MNDRLVLIAGVGLGMGVMYVLDPETGCRRRALVRDKAVRFANETSDALAATARDVRHRVRGLAAEARSRVSSGRVDDQVLAERVRARLGRVVSHPRAIEVSAQDGRVTLSGPILAREVGRLVSAVRSVRGATAVEDRLEVHQSADGVPALQGGVERTGERLDVMQARWSPTTRLLAGAAGGALAVYGAARQDGPGALLSVTGLGLVARALANVEIRDLLGMGLGAGRYPVAVDKTVTIGAPVQAVYQFWSRYENFPGFMRNVERVEDLGDGRSRWTVLGPASVPVQWEAVETGRMENRVIAWRSVGGSVVDHAGAVHFKANPDGTTTVQVRLAYTPPVGAVGHGVAWLFGADPKTEMDEDLMRMKSLIEQQARVRVPGQAGGAGL